MAEEGSSSNSSIHTHDVKTVHDNDSADPEKPIESVSDDEYPQGLRMAILVAATVIAVFLIALDQVS